MRFRAASARSEETPDFRYAPRPRRAIDDTSSAPDSSSALKPWLAFFACGGIWGSTFLFISIGNDVLAPVWAATLRLVLAAVLLNIWNLARGRRWPRGPALRAAVQYGAFQFGVNFPLLYWGEQRVPSGVAAVFYATLPLSSAFMTRALGLERLTARKLIGAAIAFSGVLLLFSSSLRGRVTPVALLSVFGGTLAAGVSTVLLKRGPKQDPVGANAVGCVVGAVIAAAASLALGERWVLPSTAAAVGPLLYLTIAGSLGAFVIMSWLIHHWPVTRASYVSVVVPIIALALGSFVRHESLTWSSVAGSAVVLAGLLIGMRNPAARAAPAPPPQTATARGA